MTFQQEERRRQELRKQEETLQEGRRFEAEERQRAEQAELTRRQQAEMEERARIEEHQRIEAEMRQKEERHRLESERLKQEEEKRRREEERMRIEEEKMRVKEEKRREEEERCFKEKARREEEERCFKEKARREEEERRFKEQKKREEMCLRQQEELRMQEIARYEKLKQEEEGMRLEEMRLEQEMRRTYEMQQQQLLFQQEQEAHRSFEQERRKVTDIEQQQKNEESVRGHIPKLCKTSAFFQSQDRINELNKGGEHLGKVKTGQVNDKRNFWIRSTSADRSGSQTLSPAPRRRKLDTWNNKQKENDDPESRPGSSLGHPNMGSVKNITSGYLSKSKSSAAVMQDVERGRPMHRTVTVTANAAWTKEKYDQQTNQNFLKSQDIKTNKVNDTITTWGKQEQSDSGRSTPVPSRHIGQVFSENKLGKGDNEKSANSWRTKTPEPSVKLVNVSVEKAVGSKQTIHISDSAHNRAASHLQETKKTKSSMSEGTSTMSSTSSAHITQPPPTPERNQSFGVAGRYLCQ